MLNITRLETRFQEIIFLLTITFSLSVAVGGVFYLSLSPAAFLSATGVLGSDLIAKGFSGFGYTYFFMVIFILHMGHLTLATAHNLSDVKRSLPVYLRSFAIYFSVLLMISSFLTVLQNYNSWDLHARLIHGYGGWFGTELGGFLYRSFGLYGALVLLFSLTSVIGIMAGFMEIVHSFYVMKDIFRDICVNLRQNGPEFIKATLNILSDFLEKKPEFVQVTSGPSEASQYSSEPVYRSYYSPEPVSQSGRLVTDHYHVPGETVADQVDERAQVSVENKKNKAPEQVHSVAEAPVQPLEKKNTAKRKIKNEVSEQRIQQDSTSSAKSESAEQAVVEEKESDLVEVTSYTKRYKKLETSLLNKPEKRTKKNDQEMIKICQGLAERLESFGIKGEVIAAHQGITLTMFEFMPAAGMKLSKIQSLSDDLALVLGAKSIRILTPIPGKTTVGIEVPNQDVGMLRFSEMVNTCMKIKNMELPVPLGLDVYNKAHVCDLTKMPHLLVSGTTGSGKSVFMNSLISGLIFHKSPKELRFLMIDPKMIELSPYNGIPHLLKPVVTDVEEAKNLLLWAEKEMDRRYQIFSEMQAKNIISFNQSLKKTSKRAVEGRLNKRIDWEFIEMPYIVIVIDELADLMLTQRNEVERPITRIAQKARAAGIHMVMATQRPSSDIVTGLIKTNFPTRVSFKVSSGIDSRTILDQPGAEKLLGNGDMLFMAQGKSIERLQGSFMTEDEVKKVVRAASLQGASSKSKK